MSGDGKGLNLEKLKLQVDMVKHLLRYRYTWSDIETAFQLTEPWLKCAEQCIQEHDKVVELFNTLSIIQNELSLDSIENCSGCPHMYQTGENYCFCDVDGYGFEYQVNEYVQSAEKMKPDWCPIKPITRINHLLNEEDEH